MQDDWLLGVSYLLNLSKDRILDAQTIFMDLPQIELYIQTALYYYSLELYKKLHTNSEKPYLHNPLDLMKKMMVAARTTEEYEDIVNGLQYWQSYLLGIAQTSETERATVKDTDALELEQDNAYAYSKETANTSTSVFEKQEPAEINISVANSENKNEELTEATIPDAIDDTVDWTDDWGDFSDDGNIEVTTDDKNKISHPPKEMSQEETIPPPDRGVAKCVTEEDRFKLFQKMFNQISNLEQYQEVKQIISRWPKFNMPHHITLNNHPILKMIKIIAPFIAKTSMADSERMILQEHEELIGLLVSKEVFYWNYISFPFS